MSNRRGDVLEAGPSWPAGLLGALCAAVGLFLLGGCETPHVEQSRTEIALAELEAVAPGAGPFEPPGSPPAPAGRSPASPSAGERSGAGVSSSTYTVASGDTLYGIARKFYGSGQKWTLIRDANSESLGSSPVLKAGMVLVIPPDK